ncbi:hypothetical protein DID75_04325 [Candidatus Marinamargulisbacteria bacterium SCGC AG-410-N11]|nr:hypothetical protein DID75_04325 [Candidatus Marinamargulisbacteria bacterium SCGC AG-410-N11]
MFLYKLFIFLTISFFCTINLLGITFQDLVLVNGFSKGFAITADRASTDGIMKNPAALGSLKRYMIKSSYSSFFNNQYQTYLLGAGFNLNGYRVGINMPMRQISSIDQTVEQQGRGVSIGAFKDSNMAVQFSLGKLFLDDNVSVGSTLGYYTHEIGVKKSNGIGLDVGVLGSYLGNNFGVSIQRVGNLTMDWGTYKETIPMTLNLGFSRTLFESLTILSDVSLQKSITSQINLGVTWSIKSLCDVNIGYRDLSGLKRLSLGLDVHLSTMTIQYAFSQHPDLGAIQKVGVTLNSF